MFQTWTLWGYRHFVKQGFRAALEKMHDLEMSGSQLTLWLFDIAIENGPVEIVDVFPLKDGGFVHIFL